MKLEIAVCKMNNFPPLYPEPLGKLCYCRFGQNSQILSVNLDDLNNFCRDSNRDMLMLRGGFEL